MISNVIITGFLSDIFKEKYRYIETSNTNVIVSPPEVIVSKIPLLYWTRESINALNNYPNGLFVIIEGHIESNDEIGFYVLVEELKVCK